MGPSSPLTYRALTMLAIGLGRRLCASTCLPAVPLICDSATFMPVGKVAQTIIKSIRKRFLRTSGSLKDASTWLMLDTRPLEPCSHHRCPILSKRVGVSQPKVSDGTQRKLIDIRPESPEEPFNLRHSSARNVIERILGVVKNRFKILDRGCSFDIHIQSGVVLALCTLPN